MLRLSDAGIVRHTTPGVHHAVLKPRRSAAEAAVDQLTSHIDRIRHYDPETARYLGGIRDTLAVVVATAY